jgi:Flp pilus assembly protein CpaB
MHRVLIALGLAVAATALSGCLAHDVDRAYLRQLRVATVKPWPPAHRIRASRAPVERTPRAVQADITMKPWPKRGTPEALQLDAEDKEREQRIQRVLRSICRGC